MNPSKFFDSSQKLQIIKAIQEAEANTSGEIRLHIENHCKEDLLTRAWEVFHELQMHETEKRNGVLIYIALKDKKMAILGDQGINNVTSDNYWESEINNMTQLFKQGQYVNGIIQTITRVGDKLKQYFPVESQNINELNDEISFYNN